MSSEATTMQYIWVPEKITGLQTAVMNDSLVVLLKKVLNGLQTINRAHLPAGRIRFVQNDGTSLYEGEIDVYNKVVNDNLTDIGLFSWLRDRFAVENFSFVRLPTKGCIVRRPVNKDLWNINQVWILEDRSFIRDQPDESIRLVNLSESLVRDANLNHEFSVVENNTTQSVHLITNEIPDTVRLIQQGAKTWHHIPTTNRHRAPINLYQTPPRQIRNNILAPPPLLRERNLMSLKLPNDHKIILATTNENIVRFLSLYFLVLKAETDMQTNEINMRIKAKQRILNHMTEERIATEYTNYANTMIAEHRNNFALVGQLMWVMQEPVTTTCLHLE